MTLRRFGVMTLLLVVVLVGCQEANDSAKGNTSTEDITYQITEENDNPEINMPNQPVSSYWFPDELLEWDPEEDEDVPYNISTVPLAERMDEEKLTPVNDTQNTDTKVVALSIMNSNTSGNPPHGINTFDN